MSAIVLCDGAAASNKAVELIGMPGVALAQHEGGQIVLVHQFSLPTAATATAGGSAAAASAGAGGGSSANSAVSGGGGGARSLVQWALQQASPDAQQGGAGDDGQQLHLRRLSGPATVAAVLKVIEDSKALRDTLNYKLETSILPPPPPPPDAALNATAGSAAGKKGGAGKKPETAKARKSEAERDPEALRALQEAEARAAAAERWREVRALIEYAGRRATHHGSALVALGVGNTLEGTKTLRPGGVCRPALAALAPAYPLFFVKADGFTLRANTARVRYVVVAPVSLLPGGEQEEEGGEEVGEEHGLLRPPPSGLEGQQAAVRYALARRRSAQAAQDEVSVVVVATPADAEEAVQARCDALEGLLAAAAAAGDENGGGDGGEGSGGGSHTNAEASAGAAAPEDTDDGAGREDSWPPVCVCALKPSKHVPQPTLADGAAQVVKFVTQRKCEFLVLSEETPAPLREALLAAAKPHCIVVPRAWPRVRAEPDWAALDAIEAAELAPPTPSPPQP